MVVTTDGDDGVKLPGLLLLQLALTVVVVELIVDVEQPQLIMVLEAVVLVQEQVLGLALDLAQEPPPLL